MKSQFRTGILVAAVCLLAACGGSRVSLDEMPRDIRWLTTSLQHKGVMVRERGNAFLSTTAISNARIIVDSREVLDAFVFQSADVASEQAYRIAGLYPQNDVFRVEALVVLRYTTRDTGLTATMVEILGTPI
jgi:hypothetical protein